MPVKEWFKKEVGVSYNTANNYIQFANLVTGFPRILMCGLSFSKIIENYNKICKRIEVNMEFATDLKLSVAFSVQGAPIELKPIDVSLTQFRGKNVNGEYDDGDVKASGSKKAKNNVKASGSKKAKNNVAAIDSNVKASGSKVNAGSNVNVGSNESDFDIDDTFLDEYVDKNASGLTQEMEQSKL